VSRRWWERRSPPSDDEIAREIRAHLDLLEEEEREGGADPDVARLRARERFGDERAIERAVRRAWSAQRAGWMDLAFPSLLSTMLIFALVGANNLRLVDSITSFLALLPSTLTAVLPTGIGIGSALAFSRRWRMTATGGLRSRCIARAFAFGVIGTVLTMAAYHFVPSANARYVELARVSTGLSPRADPDLPNPGVRQLSVPELLAHLRVVDTTWAPPVRDRVSRITRFEIHKRFALPLSCVVNALWGLACAAWLSRIRCAPLFAAAGGLGAIVLWYFVYAWAEAQLVRPGISASLLAWLPFITLGILSSLALAAKRRWSRSPTLAS
jgi:hypothetical protein